MVLTHPRIPFKSSTKHDFWVPCPYFDGWNDGHPRIGWSNHIESTFPIHFDWGSWPRIPGTGGSLHQYIQRLTHHPHPKSGGVCVSTRDLGGRKKRRAVNTLRRRKALPTKSGIRTKNKCTHCDAAIKESTSQILKKWVRYNLVKTSLALPHSRMLKTGWSTRVPSCCHLRPFLWQLPLQNTAWQTAGSNATPPVPFPHHVCAY